MEVTLSSQRHPENGTVTIPFPIPSGKYDSYLKQVQEMAARAKAAGLNIDYFPTNFIVCCGQLWYIDYECNDYTEEWNFENWGVRYWSRTPEFEEYLKKKG